MKLSKRQQKILDILTEKQRASVNYLAQTLYFSQMTIRRDLAEMEQGGLLVRYHGGAMLQKDYLDYPIEMRMHINEKEKHRLAALAEKHIKNGQVIFLPGSSTCAFLLPFLKKYEELHVMTNSLRFMLYLSKANIRCTLSGGEYNEAQGILTGKSSERFFRSINTDIAVISCDGISEDGVISVSDENAAELVRIGLENAANKVILAHSAKVGMKYTYTVGKAEDMDDIIVI